jgi:hypothetical protein
MSTTRRTPLVSPVSAPTVSASTTSATPSVIALVADEGLEVELQAGEEDRVQHPDAADRLQAGEPREQVEHVRPDDRAERQQSQEPREAQTLGDERSEHDDEPDDGEPERRGRLHRCQFMMRPSSLVVLARLQRVRPSPPHRCRAWPPSSTRKAHVRPVAAAEMVRPADR